MNKGVPYNWFSGDVVVSVSTLNSNEQTITVDMGGYSYDQCVCAINCTQETDVVIDAQDDVTGEASYASYVSTPTKIVCQDTADLSFTTRVSDPSTTSPTTYLLTFTDAFGNIKEITVPLIRWVVPKAPTVASIEYQDPGTQFAPGSKPSSWAVEISVPLQASDDTDITSSVSHYEIQRYTGHPGVLSLIRGWKEVDAETAPDNTHWDYLLREGRVFGYRVRYKSAEGDMTDWSAWETIVL
jgi:hypothetical protein